MPDRLGDLLVVHLNLRQNIPNSIQGRPKTMDLALKTLDITGTSISVQRTLPFGGSSLHFCGWCSSTKYATDSVAFCFACAFRQKSRFFNRKSRFFNGKTRHEPVVEVRDGPCLGGGHVHVVGIVRGHVRHGGRDNVTGGDEDRFGLGAASLCELVPS